MKKRDFDRIKEKLGGVSRRDFMKFCTLMASSMGLPLGMGTKIAEAVTNPRRTPVIWISAQECTGCGETLLRATHPTLEHLILDVISLDYYETLSTPAGHQAEEALQASIKENKGKFTSEGKLGSVFPLVFIPEAGHSMMMENPDAFYGEVIKFIGTL